MTFGDFTDDDAYDRAPADPAQVARKLRRLLDDGYSDHMVAVLLLAWLRRQGAT